MKEKTSLLVRVFTVCCSFFGIFALIMDGRTASSAAAEGITLCLQVLIPSLFPFLVLTKVLTSSSISRWCEKRIGPIVRKLFGLPPDGAIPLVLGAIGGYPTGARITADLYVSGLLDRQSAERLLAFTSNAGPAFFFGMIGGILGGPRIATVLYVIHLLSALMAGFLLRPRAVCRSTGRMHCRSESNAISLVQAVQSSIHAMGLICGYVVLFQVISAFLQKAMGLWMPDWIQILISGILELTSGCCRLLEVESAGFRYCMASGFLAFGGICVYLQTSAVISHSGLRGTYYLFGKILQASIAVLLTWGTMVVFPDLLPREITVSYPLVSSHSGLLRATGLVTGISLMGFILWCWSLQKKAGKQAVPDV